MYTNIVVLLYLLSVVSLFCNVTCEDRDAPYEGFLRAFPHANISALLALEKPFTVASYPYDPPPFACPSLPLPPDTNDVNNLRPGNIKVVMAMGDSISAGMSIYDNWLISLKEYRGSAFSIGSDTGRYTIPNFLTSCGFRPFGASTGGSRNAAGNGFNAAVSGAKSQDLPAQAVWLVDKLRKSPNINFLEDWKMLTIWIGSNNLCDVCNDFNGNSGTIYENNLVAALNYIADNVPRVFVNLVAPLNVAKLWEIEGAVCATIHAVACPCAGSPFSSDRDTVTQVAKDYVARSYNIARQFNGLKTDFAVVVQPFMEEVVITQRQLVSEADCFHPSAKGHALGAVALWNNMLVPSILKKKSWSEADKAICPTTNHMLHTD